MWRLHMYRAMTSPSTRPQACHLCLIHPVPAVYLLLTVHQKNEAETQVLENIDNSNSGVALDSGKFFAQLDIRYFGIPFGQSFIKDTLSSQGLLRAHKHSRSCIYPPLRSCCSRYCIQDCHCTPRVSLQSSARVRPCTCTSYVLYNVHGTCTCSTYSAIV